MTDASTLFAHLEVEALIAARDADAESASERAAIERVTDTALDALERAVARADIQRGMRERIQHNMCIWLVWAADNNWPGFRSKQVIVGTRRESVCKGLLGHREVPRFERRSVISQMSLGITTRGEFVYCGEAIRQPCQFLDIESADFPADRFDEFLTELLRYYGLSPEA